MKCCNLPMYHFFNDEIENSIWFFVFVFVQKLFSSIFAPYSSLKIFQLHTRTHPSYLLLFMSLPPKIVVALVRISKFINQIIIIAFRIRILSNKIEILNPCRNENVNAHVLSNGAKSQKSKSFSFFLSSNRFSCYFLRFRHIRTLQHSTED